MAIVPPSVSVPVLSVPIEAGAESVIGPAQVEPLPARPSMAPAPFTPLPAMVMVSLPLSVKLPAKARVAPEGTVTPAPAPMASVASATRVAPLSTAINPASVASLSPVRVSVPVPLTVKVCDPVPVTAVTSTLTGSLAVSSVATIVVPPRPPRSTVAGEPRSPWT